MYTNPGRLDDLVQQKAPGPDWGDSKRGTSSQVINNYPDDSGINTKYNPDSLLVKQDYNRVID